MWFARPERPRGSSARCSKHASRFFVAPQASKRLSASSFSPSLLALVIQLRTEPAVGARFLTRDPIEAITRSAYGYVGNNPVNYTDPSGLIGPLPIGLGYLAIEPVLSLWDAYDAYTTLSDDCAGGAEKWFAGGAFLAGVFMPGYVGWLDDIPWSGPLVRRAARSIDEGQTAISVANRSQAEEPFLRVYQGHGYRNTTGMSAVEANALYGSKTGTYHWDGPDPNHGNRPHLQAHTFAGDVVRIFFG